MTTRQEIITFCITFLATCEDYTFAEIPGKDNTAVMRRRANKKSFALIMNHDGELYLNLKCAPLEADFLRQAFEGVIPGRHFTTVQLQGFTRLLNLTMSPLSLSDIGHVMRAI